MVRTRLQRRGGIKWSELPFVSRREMVVVHYGKTQESSNYQESKELETRVL